MQIQNNPSSKKTKTSSGIEKLYKKAKTKIQEESGRISISAHDNIQGLLNKLHISPNSPQLALAGGGRIPVQQRNENLGPQFLKIATDPEKQRIADGLKAQAEEIIDGAFDQYANDENMTEEGRTALGGLVHHCEEALVEIAEDPEGYVDKKMNEGGRA
ncbi:MAG: hypothetical protein HRT47_05620 [Candidatus Caenarcaniphilales bacterium]|nr:hypothetical protein [Candidatus Caenarcaniphilales bacterium]